MALDGELSVEGLTSMAGDTQSAAMALARAIAENIDETDIARNWAKVGSKRAPLAKPAPLVSLGLASLEEEPLDELDLLTMEAALAAQTLLDYDNPAPGKRKLSRKAAAKVYEEFFDFSAADLELLANY
jgi:hypothetical protein